MGLKLSALEPKLARRIQDQMAAEDATKWTRDVVIQPDKTKSARLIAVPCDALKKRLRQDKLPNKLERDWQAHLQALNPSVKFRPQALKFRIGSGAFYKPDLIAWMYDYAAKEMRLHAWETKGSKEMKNTDRGTLAIKAAAATWPEVKFTFVWRESGVWHEQIVLP